MNPIILGCEQGSADDETTAQRDPGWRRCDDLYLQVLSGEFKETPIGPVEISVTTGLSVLVRTDRGRYILETRIMLAQIMALEASK